MVTKARIIHARKDNLTASVAPGVTDDSAAGYSVESRWIDLVADESYTLVDPTPGAAVWNNDGGGATHITLLAAGDPVVIS